MNPVLLVIWRAGDGTIHSGELNDPGWLADGPTVAEAILNIVPPDQHAALRAHVLQAALAERAEELVSLRLRSREDSRLVNEYRALMEYPAHEATR